MQEAAWKTLEAYGDLFEAFSPQEMDRLNDLVDPDVVFRDPFHEVRGRAAMRRILESMFTSFEAPRFLVDDLAMGRHQGFIQWRFQDNTGNRKGIAFPGMSSLTFGDNGLITVHQDYWDAAEAIHGRLPLIGPAIRYINGRIAAKTK